ncbi:MAG: bifunctional (p)ppGpp synthetase/guanosine-3',5'-bis(diphosphate) 3'-pyrophosphohydrolase [Bacteroidetes bacterium]|nr:MAG: bifunctional (p)ppGpp synthetase/guanosine-3',5'-bis(diphosphate) 3'-pyrophosphohydrolase [Bacteroidota bacterium]
MYHFDSEEEKKEILRRYRYLMKVWIPKREADRRMVRKAFNMALEAHKDMRRLSGEPYIYHPLDVAIICNQEIGLGMTSIICALLHDVVEDTEFTLEDIRGLFGDKVSSIIDGLTKIKGIFDQQTASIQAENFRKMLLTLSDDVRVIIIKLADRLHNLRTLDALPEEKRLKVASETIYLYAPLAHRLGLHAIKTEMEDLAMKYTDPEIYEAISNKLKESERERIRFINKFIEPIRKEMTEKGILFSISGREKSISSIWEKMKKKEVPFEEVYDVFAIRIILDSPPETEKADCWKAYSAVTDIYRPNMERLRDWISIPKANGYEALHTTVMSHTGRWVEIQIRSKRMDEIAEKGYAAHWKYKDSIKMSSQLERWLDRIKEMLDSPGEDALAFIHDIKGYFFLDEISLFTPQGELRTLPANSSVLDFAFAIHSEIGNTCIGAKVDKKLVPINTILQNGQQVEIITSSKQSPREEWLNYVVTTRAKSNIKQSVREYKKKFYDTGQEKMKGWFEKMNIEVSPENFRYFQAVNNFSSIPDLFFAAAQDKIGIKDVKAFATAHVKSGWLTFLTKPGAKPRPKEIISSAREPERTPAASPSGSAESGKGNRGFEVALCCNPIPGDEVIGLVASEQLPIQIHRTNCLRAIELMSSFGNKMVKVNWTNRESISFLTGIKFTGNDRMGMLADISRVISSELHLNIKSFTLHTENGYVEGDVRLFVQDVGTLNRLLMNLREIEGVRNVTRVDEKSI